MKFTRPPLPAFPNSELLQIQRLWTELQTLLNSDAVLRWQSYKGLNGGIRHQNLIEHSYSIAVLGTYVVDQLRLHIPSLDMGLILKGLLIHDIGEALLKRDVPYTEKKATDDVDEYEAVRDALSGLPDDLRGMYLEAFLLQFCLDEKKFHLFDEEAQQTLRSLASSRQWDARVFNLIEHVDYLMFMVETYKAGNDYLLYHVLKSTELSAWEDLAASIPGVEELILGAETMAWFKEFMANYEANGGDMVPTHEK